MTRAVGLLAMSACAAPAPVDSADTGTAPEGYWDTTCRVVRESRDAAVDGTIEAETTWVWQPVSGVGMMSLSTDTYSGVVRSIFGNMFDDQGRLLLEGRSQAYQYDDAGDQVYKREYSLPGSLSNDPFAYTYDAHHNQVEVIIHDREAPRWSGTPPEFTSHYQNTYDAEGRLLSIEESYTGGAPWELKFRWEYNEVGLLVAYDRPSYSEHSRYGYDDLSRPLWKAAMTGGGRCLGISTYVVDEVGNILEDVEHDGCDPEDAVTFVTRHTWDDAGHELTREREDFAGLATGLRDRYTWTYDERGNVTSELFDDVLTDTTPGTSDVFTTWTWECP